MAKFDMTQLEKATSIPAGSLHLVEMGDGSGTKAVTQEVLEEKIGEALKVGDLEQLQTEDKTNLVAAINEAAQSGGGGAAVDILDSKEEIEANTEAGKAAGALAVQEMFGELNDNLVSMTDSGAIKGLDAREDGVYITYVPSAGADPVTKKLGNVDFEITANAYITLWKDGNGNGLAGKSISFTANYVNGQFDKTSSGFQRSASTQGYYVSGQFSAFNIKFKN